MRNITSWGEKTGKSSSVAFRASSLKQASSFELFDVDFRLLASCSRLLAVACWLPPLACPLSYAGCRLLASIFHLLASTCWLPSPAYWLLPVGFHIYLTCPFSLSPAGCRLLAVAMHRERHDKEQAFINTPDCCLGQCYQGKWRCMRWKFCVGMYRWDGRC